MVHDVWPTPLGAAAAAVDLATGAAPAPAVVAASAPAVAPLAPATGAA
jgi:hypothetical protein